MSGRYRLLERLGAGGMGEVWRARDEDLGREVALKVFSPPEDSDAEERAELLGRFRREARAAAGLDSPHIVTVHDHGTDGDTPYLIMELVVGRSLEQVLRAEGRVPLRQALDWAGQICRALALAHAAGIVHRDIKPANVMVRADGTAVVLDFGIAGLLEAAEAVSGSARLTRPGQLPVGSVLYMAPERFRQEPSDGRTDLYGLGCVLYELLVGRPPFTGPAAGVMYNHLHDQPLLPSRARAELSTTVDTLILDLMAKEPDQRPGDAQQARVRIEALRAAQDVHEESVPESQSPPASAPDPNPQRGTGQTPASVGPSRPATLSTLAAEAATEPKPLGPQPQPEREAGTEPSARRETTPASAKLVAAGLGMALLISLGAVAVRTDYFSSGSQSAPPKPAEEVREPSVEGTEPTAEGIEPTAEGAEPTEEAVAPVPKAPDRYLIALVGDAKAMNPMVKVVENVLASRKKSFRIDKPVKVVAIEPGTGKWDEVEEDPGLIAVIGDTYAEKPPGARLLPDSVNHLIAFDTCGFRDGSTDYAAGRSSSLAWPDTAPFPLHASESALAKALASYLGDVRTVRSVALMIMNKASTFGPELRSALQEKGVRVAVTHMTEFYEDADANIGRIKNSGAEALLFETFDYDKVRFGEPAAQWRLAAEFDGPVLVPDLPEISCGQTDKKRAPGPTGLLRYRTVSDDGSAYAASLPAQRGAAEIHDAAVVLAEALTDPGIERGAGGTTGNIRERLGEVIRNNDEVTGLLGRYTFAGDPYAKSLRTNAPAWIDRYNGKRWEELATITQPNSG
ncbi:protein kinase [Streptomyces sp. YC419]|uniref:non-specific serine/threonine protein kinase n=1 Tax=Streptomyces ureilyticus TaxID=1775131 RepID=A0ABX0DT08_9ACTN|nr:protein kinase [Streptomyces ureilyticus]